jgi:uncharacterized protein (TIGR02271 family)
MNTKKRKNLAGDENPDPISGAPGSHPIGTGVGAAGGGAAGAAIGAAGGPVGSAIGLVTGAVAGGLAGKGVAEAVNPTEEEAYWREHHARQPYSRPDRSYDDYAGAYRTGFEGYARYASSGRRYEEVESDLRRDYESRGSSAVSWDEARSAARAAWDRIDRRFDRIIGYEVVDRNGNDVGKVQNLWTDESGQPAFLGVTTGWLFGKNHVVPAQNVDVNERRRKVRLPYSEIRIKEAPSFAADSELTEAEVNKIYGYYDIEQPVAAQSAVEDRPNRTERSEDRGDERVIELREEQLRVGKRDVEAGVVRLRKIVRTEVVTQPVELEREDIVIERVPVNREAGEDPVSGEAFQDEEIYIPLRREEAVVAKENRVREEVRVRKKVDVKRETVSETVRKDDLEVNEDRQARR